MKIEFSTDNASFCNPFTGAESESYEALECKKILKKIIDKIDDFETEGIIIDTNGNKIGSWEL